MRYAIILVAALSTSTALAEGWADGPGAWKNLDSTWHNQSSSWQNYPHASHNRQRVYPTGYSIYDSRGNRIGYSVPRPDGTVNHFSNDGRRMGFTSPRRESDQGWICPMPSPFMRSFGGADREYWR